MLKAIRTHGPQRYLLIFGVSLLLMFHLANPLVANALPPQSSRGNYAAKSGHGKKDCGLPMIEIVPTQFQSEAGKLTGRLTTGGYTAVEYPEMWVNIPYTAEELQNLVLTVRDSTGQKYYEASIPRPAGEGLMKLQLPQSHGLKNRDRYDWSLQATLQCGTNSNGEPIVVTSSASAWIERYQPEQAAFTEQLARSSDLEKVEQYSQANYWYDAFSLMAKLRQDNLNDPQLQESWNLLLGEHGLCTLAGRPFAPAPAVASIQAQPWPKTIQVSQLLQSVAASGCSRPV
ncbi:MAG: DUF928 domain-containing protein [Synechococcales cyanobacterium RM1_1_8]|nr:DUF928 domain-containing protein [Synechococcales cyanobacterium RM1_1_8]